MYFIDSKINNIKQCISLATEPFKVKNRMLWTTCQNFT